MCSRKNPHADMVSYRFEGGQNAKIYTPPQKILNTKTPSWKEHPFQNHHFEGSKFLVGVVLVLQVNVL